MHPSTRLTLARLALCALVAFAALPTPIRAQDAQNNPPQARADFRPGQKVNALITGQWVECTVVERTGTTYTVSPAYPNWADEMYAYSAIKIAGQNVNPERLRPGQAVEVLWGNSYWAARIIDPQPNFSVIRWDRSRNTTARVSAADIKSIPQPTPKPGQGQANFNAPPARKALPEQPPEPADPQPGLLPKRLAPEVLPERLAPEPIKPLSRLTNPEPADTTHVQFLDTANKPLAGLALKPISGSVALTTNPNGDLRLTDFWAHSLAFTASGQTYQINTQHPRFKEKKNIIAPLALGPAQGIDVVEIQAQVSLPDGTPAANAWAWVHSLQREQLTEDWSWLRAKTNSQGQALFKMLPLSPAQLGRKPNIQGFVIAAEPDPAIALFQGAQASFIPVYQHFEPDQKVQLTFQTGQPRLLVFTDPLDNPLPADDTAKAKVFFTQPLPGDPILSRVPWVPGKPFAFPPGQYAIEAGRIARQFTIEPESEPENIRINMRSLGYAAGRILDASGKPAPDTVVLMMPQWGQQYGPDDLTPEAWKLLQQAKPQPDSTNESSIIHTFTLRNQRRSFSLIGFGRSDTQGKFNLDSPVGGTIGVFGPTLLNHRVTPDYKTYKPVDLYAIPSATVTITPVYPSGIDSPSAPRIRILFPDDRTPAPIKSLDPADYGVPATAEFLKPVTFRVPAGYPVKIKLTSANLDFESVAATLRPGDTLDIGHSLLTRRPPNILDIVATDAGQTPLPNIKLTLESPSPSFKTTVQLDPTASVNITLPKDVSASGIRASLQPENGLPLTVALADIINLKNPKESITTALFPHRIQKLPSTDIFITDAAGTAQPGMPIRVDGYLGSKPFDTGIDATLPASSINALLPYRLTFSGPGNTRYFWSLAPDTHPRTLPIPVSGNATLPVIEGQVLLPDGTPAANCPVGARAIVTGESPLSLLFASPPSAGVFTDTDGRFRFSPTWNPRESDYATPPKRWVVVAQSPDGQNLAAAVATWNYPGKTLSMKLENTQPVRVSLALPKAYDLHNSITVTLSRIDPATNTRFPVAALIPGKQTLNLAPGQYLASARLASLPPITLAPGQTTLDLAYPIDQAFNFTLIDQATQKPIRGGFVSFQSTLADVSNWSDQQLPDFNASGPSSPDGHCSITYHRHPTQPSPLEIMAFAKDYLPVNLQPLADLANVNAQGIKHIRVTLEPALQARLVLPKEPRLQTNGLHLTMLPPTVISPLEPGLLEPARLNSDLFTVTRNLLLIPRDRPAWLIGKNDEGFEDNREGTLTTRIPGTLWLTQTKVSPAGAPPGDVTLTAMPTVPFKAQAVSSSGKPLANVLIGIALDDPTFTPGFIPTDKDGSVTLNVPSDVPLRFFLCRSTDSRLITEPGWVQTISAGSTTADPFTLKITAPSGF